MIRSRIVKTPPKKPGRDGERTRQRILAAASNEFASKGYDGARIDEIVRRCRVNKNLLYYYFGSKEKLFVSVLEAAYADLRRRQDAFAPDDGQPEHAIRRLVADLFHYWRESEAFIGFLTSENLYKAKHIKKSKFAAEAYEKLIESLSDVLEAGARQGVFRKGVDPVHLYISISGLSYKYFSNQYTLSSSLGKDLTSEEALKTRLQHVEEMVLGYLRPAA
ncbi:MAG TPA: TetR/AcrR family transcriptional regulator [Bradyrhizobium sp.]|nr:TetR/AcrR family transcriptional regulator [Bradyrhizobium sp.]